MPTLAEATGVLSSKQFFALRTESAAYRSLHPSECSSPAPSDKRLKSNDDDPLHAGGYYWHQPCFRFENLMA
jgi:hypothetical protein